LSNHLNAAVFEHQFWLQVLGDHSRFIRDSLYASQQEDLAKAIHFIEQFDHHLMQANFLNQSNLVPFSAAVEEVVNQLKDFKLSILSRHLTGQMGIHLTPTFINHMVNELEEYQRVLSYLKQGQAPPICHELHHHLIWLVDAVGHAGAINDLMDAVEKRLKKQSHKFTKHFEQFYLKAVELTGYLRTNIHHFPALNRFTHEVELEMNLFMTFLKELEELELSAEVLSTFTPSMADHMYREEQYYLMKLAESYRSDSI